MKGECCSYTATARRIEYREYLPGRVAHVGIQDEQDAAMPLFPACHVFKWLSHHRSLDVGSLANTKPADFIVGLLIWT